MNSLFFAFDNTLANIEAYSIPLPFTGDNSKLGLVAVIMGVALVVIIALLISMRRK